MADEYAQNLPDIPERTATADTDLVHVNSGGSDYKQTKANFTSDLAKEISFSTSSTLTSQVDALSVGGYYGFIASYGHQSATGMPYDVNFFVTVQKYDSNNCTVHAIARGTNPRKWTINKANSWGSWIEDPSRDEISALNNSLTNWNYYQVGSNSYGVLECRYNPSLKLCFMVWRGNSTAPSSAQYSFTLPSSPVLTPNDNVVAKLRNGDSMEVRTDNTVKVNLTGTSWSTRSNSYKWGNIIVVAVRFQVTSSLAIYDYVLQIPSAYRIVSDVYAPLMSSYFTTMADKGLYADAGSYTIRASAAIPSGNYSAYIPLLVRNA